VGGYYGSLISTNTPGVSETVPLYLLKIAKGVSQFRPEFFYASGSSTNNASNEINYQLFGATLKNIIRIKDLSEIQPFVLTGLQYSKYDTTTVGANAGGGFHLGFGFDYVLSKNIQLRNDYMMCNGPGRFLVISIGIQFTLGTEEATPN